MEAVLRVATMYFFLMLVFRVSDKRSLAESTPFDLLMLLIISETTQQAMVADDHSLVGAGLMILTLVTLDIGLSCLKQRSPRIARWLEDVPLLIVADGEPLKDRMGRSRIDDQDILEAARELRGLERMDQIKYAVLERHGKISIIPRDDATNEKPV